MSDKSQPWTDYQVEQLIGRLLRAGVVLSAAVVLIGGIAYLLQYGSHPANYGTFQGVSDGLDSVHGVLAGAAELRSRWIVQFGLLLLIATPIVRVGLSLAAFARQRDGIYVAITALVLALLLFSLLGG